MIQNNITTIAIGGFDGMHQAHQKLFLNLEQNKSAIIVIKTKYANLSPTSREQHSVHPIYYYKLNNIKHLSSFEFVELLLKDFPNLNKIVVGYDFHFGSGASCGVECLKELFNGEVIVIDEFKIDSISVHSRIIRDALKNSDLQKANKLLGYNYTLQGTHIQGQGIGLKELVPTINLSVCEYLIPAHGVYKTNTIVNSKIYKSISFIGHRMTADGNFAVETHILEIYYDGVVSNNISIEFISKIRENKKFDSLIDLKKQIKKDITLLVTD